MSESRGPRALMVRRPCADRSNRSSATAPTPDPYRVLDAARRPAGSRHDADSTGSSLCRDGSARPVAAARGAASGGPGLHRRHRGPRRRGRPRSRRGPAASRPRTSRCSACSSSPPPRRSSSRSAPPTTRPTSPRSPSSSPPPWCSPRSAAASSPRRRSPSRACASTRSSTSRCSTPPAWRCARWPPGGPTTSSMPGPLSARLDGSLASVAGALLAVGAFLVVNHTSLVLVLLWARGVRPARHRPAHPRERHHRRGPAGPRRRRRGPVVRRPVARRLRLRARSRCCSAPCTSRSSSRPAAPTPRPGLANAAWFVEQAEEELHRAQRLGQPLSVLVADLDLLRNINNAYGHLAGDVVLKGVADVLRAEIREYDVACRFGGEEFAVLLPGRGHRRGARGGGADPQPGRPPALRGRHLAWSRSARPSRSAWRRCSEHGQTVKELMHAADLAVYRAKVDGRDRVRLASADDEASTAPATAPRTAPAAPTAEALRAAATRRPGPERAGRGRRASGLTARALQAATASPAPRARRSGRAAHPGRARHRRATAPCTAHHPRRAQHPAGHRPDACSRSASPRWRHARAPACPGRCSPSRCSRCWPRPSPRTCTARRACRCPPCRCWPP